MFISTEKEKGQLGVGKSCLCNRFVRTHADDYNVDHICVLSQSDFSGLGKTETYVKRCVATKLQSAEKLMYVCKNQLGIEKEYDQRLMPDGKLSVDGFLCVYDVSLVPGRTWEKQNEVLAAILQNIIKLKKPVVLVTSKNDEACEQGVREAERLVQRKEFKGSIPIVETSSHDNVNVDHAFFLLAQMVDKSKARIKVANYAEALRIRRETLDFVTEAFTQLIRMHVQDHNHRDFSVYFSEGRHQDSGSESGSELDSPLAIDTTLRVGERARYQTLGQSQKIPYEILESNEAAAVFKTFLHEAQEEHRNYENCSWNTQTCSTTSRAYLQLGRSRRKTSRRSLTYYRTISAPGVEGIAGEFGKRLLAGCDAERRVNVAGHSWRVEQRVRTDDFSAETTCIDDFAPNGRLYNVPGFLFGLGYFCVYQDQESFEYIRGCAEKTLLSSLEQEDKLPFQGLPLVVMFVQDEGLDKKELTRLQEEGQNLADNAFSMNIPNLPIQMVAVTDGGGSASTFFGTDLGHALITEGNATADRLAAHFTTYTSSAENKSAFYTPFFKEVWERKGEIERAFRMEQPHNLPDVAAARPAPPPRNHSYHLNHMREHKLTNSLDLLIGPDSRADIDSEYSDTLNNSKNRGFLKGFSVYPPPSTPPEPAPPDHRMHADLSPDLNCSEDSLSTHESDGGGLWQPASYGHRAFTTGRTRPHQPPPRVRHSQTLKQPGKLDMNNYTMVSDALQHITIGPPAHSRSDRKILSGEYPSSAQDNSSSSAADTRRRHPFSKHDRRHKGAHDPKVDLDSLDIPVNAVATALKDFFSKRLPPLLDEASMAQLEDIARTHNAGCIRDGRRLTSPRCGHVTGAILPRGGPPLTIRYL
ncbi:hypothetical protein HF086_010866 [Spodoptera exigua]|uniref:Rho GTPase-activating protein pG1 and pG2 domain-containing protein n=1 Tax=Spodoptera exigua TaxID=7107 RepID=A0A922MD59_SPOEX|nr:hypothetical protein HF086_010866 [Spodoptera exigua]